MSATTTDKATSSIETRVLREGYGEGAWHGPELKTALADVARDAAFRRPAAGRHNIAEIAVHHVYYVHVVRAKITGDDLEPFVLEGDDWFTLNDESRLPWSKILEVVATEHQRLADSVASIGGGRRSPLPEPERFDLVLGITCHAVYHAGQIQLVKRLIG